MSIDQFVSFVHDHASAKAQENVVGKFKKVKNSLDGCSQNAILTACKAIDPQTHPVGHGCLLSIGCSGNITWKRNSAYWLAMHTWLEICDEGSMKLMPVEAGAVCRAFIADAMADPSNAESALPTLWRCMRKLQPSPEHMTPFHAAVLQASIRCKRYAVGSQLLEEEIFKLADTGMTSTDYLLYAYYGALVCIALKDYKVAFRLLEMAMCMPTMVPSSIMLAAWQRYQIITAISKGQEAKYPSHASNACKGGKMGGREADVVGQLVKAFLANKQPAFDKLLQDEEAYLKNESLYGLAKQMQDQLTSHAIRKMTGTYSTLPLQKVAADAGLQGPEEASKHVFKMIAAGELKAVIDEQQGMVKFGETGPEEEVNAEMIQDRMQKIAGLQRRLVLASREAQLESKAIQQLLKQEGITPHIGGLGVTEVADITPDAMDDM